MEEGQRAIKAMKGARVGQWPINVGWSAAQQVRACSLRRRGLF